MKRAISLALVTAMIIAALPISAFAGTGQDGCVIGAKDIFAMAGQSVCVEVEIQGNPGIQGASLCLEWDVGLTLESAENGKAFQMLDLTLPGRLVSGKNFIWYRQAPVTAEDIEDGTILKLNFRVSAQAENGSKFQVRASYNDGDIFGPDLQPVSVALKTGTIRVVSYRPGDVDGNDRLNPMDLVLLSRYIADGCVTDPEGYNVTLNPNAGDVNDDGRLNPLDLVLTSRYIADGCVTDPEGYNVTLKPSSHDFGHVHSLTAIPYRAATCTEPGNIAYWQCSDCGKCFRSEAGTAQVELEETVIEAPGHTIVVDPAVPATSEKTGLTEGSHCSVCDLVLVKQEVYGPLEANTANIIYKLVNESKDPYLAQQTIYNSNPLAYEIGKGLTLSNDLSVAGYTFAGWYDSFSDNAAQIKTIPSTATGDITVYAHWEEVVYDITYNLYQTPVTSSPTTEQTHFTVSKGNSNLYNPEINNYIFLGWYDNDGVEYKTIPIGTTGNIVLNAYYTSLRNLAVSKEDKNPIIVEDNDNNVVYFTYEIGEIRNIPLNASHPFWEVQSVAGLSQTTSQTYQTEIRDEDAASVVEEISNQTVESDTWTLSKDWNDVITVNETWAESIGKETEQCKRETSTASGSMSISNQEGGSSYHKTEDGYTVYDYNSKTETKDKGHQFDASLSGTYSNKLSANLGASNEYGTEGSYQASNAYTTEGKVAADKWSASGSQSGSQTGSSSVSDKDKYSAGISYENGYEFNGGLKYAYHNNTNTVTKTGSDTVTVKSNIAEDTSSWNNSQTFTATNTRSASAEVRNKVSDIVTTTKGYGSSYSTGGSDSKTQGFASTASNTTGTTSSVTHSKTEGEITTTEYSVDGRIEGNYRCVLAGTAHVFGVAGYDYNTRSYFAYTFSVMDDKMTEFLDYTPKGGDFTDCQNSCLPFDVPTDVFVYVEDRIAKTSGLQHRTDSIHGTAKITGYEGTDTDVIIPAYVSDGKQAYKVTEIANTAFAGKPVRAVVLGEFIRSIPDGAFKDCTELEAVIGSFTEIGDEAFAGCEKLENMNIPSNVVKIGVNAFEGVPSIHVRAINSLCAYTEAAEVLPYDATSSEAETEEEIQKKTEKIEKEREEKRAEVTQKFIRSVLESGAQNISIDLSAIADGVSLNLVIPEIESVQISGGGRTYRNFSIESHAAHTELREMTVRSTGSIPLMIDSDELTLHKVFVDSSAAALILKKDGVMLSLDQDSALQSSANYTVIGKNPVIRSQVSPGGATGFLLINGNFGYVDSIQGEAYVEISGGRLRKITEEEFEQYIQGAYSVRFDANGGRLEADSKMVSLGAAIGELPEPTRDYHSFVGWFTGKEDGEKVTEGWKLPDAEAEDVTLYAHWTLNPLSDWVRTETAPADGQIADRKWTYDLTSYTTSSSPTMDGWTCYDSSYVWSAWGSWSGWSESYAAASEAKQVETRTGYHYYYYICPNCGAHTYQYGKCLTWAGGCGYSAVPSSSYTGFYCGNPYSSVTDLGGTGVYYTDNTEGNGRAYTYPYSSSAYYVAPVTQYQYRTREKLWTYSFSKLEEKETTAYPTGSNISNIQEWVRYREK